MGGGGWRHGIQYWIPLTQLFFLEQLTAGQDPERCRKEIEDSRAFHSDAMNEMLATGTFDKNFTADQLDGKFDGQRMSDVCRAEFAKVTTLMDQYINSYLKLQETKKSYDAAAQVAVDETEKVESLADGYVDEITASVSWAKMISASSPILIPLIATIVVGFYVGLERKQSGRRSHRSRDRSTSSHNQYFSHCNYRTHLFDQWHCEQHCEPLRFLVELPMWLTEVATALPASVTRPTRLTGLSL